MAFKPKSKKQEEVVIEKPIEKAKTSKEEIVAREILEAAQKTEKAHKDALLMNEKELQSHLKRLREEISAASSELDSKYKAIRYADDDIKAKSYELARMNETFEKKNKEKLEYIDKRQKEVDEAAAVYTSLNLTTQAKKKELEGELFKIYEERRSHKTEQSNLYRQVDQMQATLNKQEIDISSREKKLQDEKEALEARILAIQPEFDKVQEVKNENLLLWQQLEEEKKAFDNQKRNFENYKEKMAKCLLMNKLNYGQQKLDIEKKVKDLMVAERYQ